MNIHKDIEGTQICVGDEIVVSSSSGSWGGNSWLTKQTVKNLTDLSVTFVGGGRTESPTRRILILKGEFKK